MFRNERKFNDEKSSPVRSNVLDLVFETTFAALRHRRSSPSARSARFPRLSPLVSGAIHPPIETAQRRTFVDQRKSLRRGEKPHYTILNTGRLTSLTQRNESMQLFRLSLFFCASRLAKSLFLFFFFTSIHKAMKRHDIETENNRRNSSSTLSIGIAVIF